MCHAVRDLNARQIGATGERRIPDDNDASVIWNDTVFATRNQRFALRLDQAIPRAVIDRIPCGDHHARQLITAGKSLLSDECDAVRNDDARQVNATEKCKLPDGSDAVADRHALKLFTPTKRRISDDRHGQSLINRWYVYLLCGTNITGHAIMGTVIRKGKDKSFCPTAFIYCAAHRTDAVNIVMRDTRQRFLLDKYFVADGAMLAFR